MTHEEYRKKLYEDVFNKIVRIPGGNPDVVVPYFEGHWPRFAVQLDMFQAHLADKKIGLVYDFGTGCPFTSYWFNLVHNARIRYGFPGEGESVTHDVAFLRVDLIRPPALEEKADVIIATEVIEHLPCNTYRVRQWLCEQVASGGHLLLSFPLNGLRPRDYHLDNLGDYNSIHHEHIREYTEQTAREWYIGTGFDLVEEKTVYTVAYGGHIMNVLLRKGF